MKLTNKRKIYISIAVVFAVSLSLFFFKDHISNAQKRPPRVRVIVLLKEKFEKQDNDEVASNDGEVTRTYRVIKGFLANIPRDKIDKLKHNPRVLSVDEDVEVTALDIDTDKKINADQVWNQNITGTGTPIAILDTGITLSHKEFTGRIAKCHNELFADTTTCDDQNGHGTHAAGIAAAAGVNLLAKGVAPGATLYIDQVLDSAGKGTLSGIIAGVDWAVTNGAKVISMSLGTSPVAPANAANCDNTFPTMTTAVNNAIAAGVVVVAAAGNSGTTGVGAPACISNTIAVTAADNTDTIANFSSQGGAISDHGITAPGVSIYSAWTTGYAKLSGTSMAAPHIAGVAALLITKNPSLSPAEIRNALFDTACRQNSNPSCPTGTIPNALYGYGRVDAWRAYAAATGVSNPPPSPTPPPPSPVVPPTPPPPPPSPPASFSILGNPQSAQVRIGSSVNYQVAINTLGMFPGTINFSLTGLLENAAYSFLPNPVASTASSTTLTVYTTSTTPITTVNLLISGTSFSLGETTSTTVILRTLPGSDFSLAVSPSSRTVKKGRTTTYTVAISAINGFNDKVSFSVNGLPQNTSASFKPATLNISGKTVMTISANGPLGTYPLSIIAQSTGGLTRKIQATLTITR